MKLSVCQSLLIVFVCGENHYYRSVVFLSDCEYICISTRQKARAYHKRTQEWLWKKSVKVLSCTSRVYS